MDLLVKRTETLPQSSQEIQAAIAAARTASRLGGGPDPGEAELENEILLRVKGAKQKFPVLLVDDEAVYRNGVNALLEQNPTVASFFEVLFATNDKEAMISLHERRHPRLAGKLSSGTWVGV
jgi:PleD family two-component response regulator